MTDMRRSAWSFQRSYLTEDAAPPSQSVDSVDPNNGSRLTPSFVIVYFTGFADTEIASVKFGGVLVDDWGSDGPTSISVLPAASGSTGPVNVTITLNDTTVLTLVNGFTYT